MTVHIKDEWEEDEEEFLTQGLNPHFITKDTTNMSKAARQKINMARKVVKEQGSVKQVNPVIGVSARLHEDHEAWYEIERERHFPVEFYRVSAFTGVVNKEPEPCEWILNMKTSAEEKQIKENVFMQKLRKDTNSQIVQDLKFMD